MRILMLIVHKNGVSFVFVLQINKQTNRLYNDYVWSAIYYYNNKNVFSMNKSLFESLALCVWMIINFWIYKSIFIHSSEFEFISLRININKRMLELKFCDNIKSGTAWKKSIDIIKFRNCEHTMFITLHNRIHHLWNHPFPECNI